MATTKNRINVSLSDQTKKALSKLAARDQVPTATFAARMIETALELEEDQVWNELAEKRDTKNARFVTHQKAWK
ncbi:MAG: hypothetical protein ACR2FM_01645 [Candidatus Saccharimonadales bacterium]